MAWFFWNKHIKRNTEPLRSDGEPSPEVSHGDRTTKLIALFLQLLLVAGGMAILLITVTQSPVFNAAKPPESAPTFVVGDYYVVGDGWHIAATYGQYAARFICEKDGVYRECYPVKLSPDAYATLQASKAK